MATRTVACIAVFVLLQGCSTAPRFEKNFGVSVRANLAAQTVDPRGAANANPEATGDWTHAVIATAPGTCGGLCGGQSSVAGVTSPSGPRGKPRKASMELVAALRTSMAAKTWSRRSGTR